MLHEVEVNLMDDNDEEYLYKLTYKKGQYWWGGDKSETRSIWSNQTFYPTDIVKITKVTYEGIDCKYWNADSEVVSKPGGIKNEYKGDKCGKYWIYEADKVLEN